MSWEVRQADCVEAMQEMDEASVDAVVCDPPYNLSFMGKAWDKNLNHGPWATEALRVLKPGGHLLAFGGTRTFHRLTCALEDAGFEIRDCLSWLYGSGFPKSLDVSKAIDRAAGKERRVVGKSARHIAKGEAATSNLYAQDEWTRENGRMGEFVTAPATPESEKWNGYGTALKPAWEPIVMARKPLVGTVAKNVQEHGTGALNVEATRIGTANDEDARRLREWPRPNTAGQEHCGSVMNRPLSPTVNTHAAGRWPANVTLDEQAAALLDEQTGTLASGGGDKSPRQRFDNNAYGHGLGYAPDRPSTVPDSGGASRFFYVAKASRSERNAGLGGFEERESREWRTGNAPPNVSHRVQDKRSQNGHPTVKPLALMRWLCRLVTPSEGLILDPFTGSGTTGIAAVLEDFDFLGIEREPEYVEIARARIEHWSREAVQLGLEAA